MRRVTMTLALAVGLLGCGPPALPADHVALIIDESVGGSQIGCTLMPTYGELVAHPEFGVAFNGSGGAGFAPAVWPKGYTGRRVGSEVEVLDSFRNVVTTTGVGLQRIYWVGKPGTVLPSGTICSAARAEDHLQPLPS